MNPQSSIYTVPVQGIDCRCARELINIKVAQLAGVEAVSTGDDDVVIAVVNPEVTSPSDIIRAIVDAGYVPSLTVEVAEVSTQGPSTSYEVEALDEAPAEEAAQVAEVREPAEAPLEAQPAATEALEEVAAEEIMSPLDVIEASIEEPVLIYAATAYAGEPQAAAESASPAAIPLPEAPVMRTFPGIAETEPVASFARAALVQRVEVAVSDGFYPNRLVVSAGVPVEIAFGEGHGCMARVLFDDFEVDADLTGGGSVVRLGALAPGVYAFSCGMHMVHGTLAVEANPAQPLITAADDNSEGIR